MSGIISWMSGGISIQETAHQHCNLNDTQIFFLIIFNYTFILCEPTTGCTSYHRYNLLIRRQPRKLLNWQMLIFAYQTADARLIPYWQMFITIYNKSSLCRLLTLLKILNLTYTYPLLQFLSTNCVYTSFILGLLPFMCLNIIS